MTDTSSLPPSSPGHPAITPERILQMSWGFAAPLILEVAVKNRVFDFLDGSDGRTVSEVAKHTGGSERGWSAILNALAGFQLLIKSEDRYSTSPESSTFLVTGKPAFVGGIFKHASTQLIPAWLSLNDIVHTGRPVTRINHHAEGEKFFAEFVSDIFSLSYPSARLLAAHLIPDGTVALSVLDVAAGSGVWGIAMAQASAGVHVTAHDLPGVLPITRQHVEKFGLTTQFAYCEGDLLVADYPTGIDVAILGQILHSEGEARSRQLLKKVAGSLRPGGTIAIAEFTPNASRTAPPQALIFSVNMLVHSETGDTFPFGVVAGWLEEAGFENAREMPCPGPSPLILATKK